MFGRFAKREPELTVAEEVQFLTAAHRHAIRRGDALSILTASVAADHLVSIGRREIGKL